MLLRKFICPFCGRHQETNTPPDKCNSCMEWLVPPSLRNAVYPAMAHINKITITDGLYCDECQAYKKFVGVYDISCPECADSGEHENDELLFLNVKTILREVLEYSKIENPDISAIRKKLQECDEWFRKYDLPEYEESDYDQSGEDELDEDIT